jgi:putative glutamine amidotransferase
MPKPRIAIPIPTTIDLLYNQRSWPQYASCIERAGGEPVGIELGQSRKELSRLLESCDGFCLPGSPSDVDPDLYGEDRDPATAVHDASRYEFDVLALEHATYHAKPVLAICYGLQSLNTWRGGSLVQDLNPVPVNHAAGGKVAIAHTAVVAKDSFLATLLDPAEITEDPDFHRLPVNSSHHQAVASPGDGLRIVARCPEDGVIEALEIDPAAFTPESHIPGKARFLVGVQWHPERSYDISATSRRLFDHLIAETARISDARPLPNTSTADNDLSSFRAAGGSASADFDTPPALVERP